MIALRLAGCLVTGLVLLGGCNQTQQVDTTGGAPREMVSPAKELVAQGRSPIPDVPVPLGFSLDETRSRNFTAGGLRYVDHLYRGKADKFAVARFYAKQMPISRWVRVTETFTQGVQTLNFEKESERCSVSIYDRSSLFSPTVIEVLLFSSGRIETPGNEPKGSARR